VNSTTKIKNITGYQAASAPKALVTQFDDLASQAALEFTKKEAKIAGKVRNDWAKMIGIIPAMFTISGRLLRTGMDMRLPILRPGNITGTLRRPCWTYTIAKMVITRMMTTMKIIHQDSLLLII